MKNFHYSQARFQLSGGIMHGKIIGIYTARKGDKPVANDSVEVIAGKGIVGDRYFAGEGTFSKKLAGNRKSEITFIEAEQVERFNQTQGSHLAHGDLRAAVLTSGAIEVGQEIRN